MLTYGTLLVQRRPEDPGHEPPSDVTVVVFNPGGPGVPLHAEIEWVNGDATASTQIGVQESDITVFTVLGTALPGETTFTLLTEDYTMPQTFAARHEKDGQTSVWIPAVE
jgi:hypothetical protein